mmetsp:Transcript_22556/g.32723  ORF Transcript_22556/g.32723 Transcript_22556/m.32723 type:complete len:240 (+) Transcript_22556:2252-2971(+)
MLLLDKCPTVYEQDDAANRGGVAIVRKSLSPTSEIVGGGGLHQQNFNGGGGNTVGRHYNWYHQQQHQQQRGATFLVRSTGSEGGGIGHIGGSTGSLYGLSSRLHNHQHGGEGRGPPPPYRNAHPEESLHSRQPPQPFNQSPQYQQHRSPHHKQQQPGIPSLYFVSCHYKKAFKQGTFLLPGLKKALNMNNDDFLNGLDSSTPGGGGSSIDNNGGSIYIQVCERNLIHTHFSYQPPCTLA